MNTEKTFDTQISMLNTFVRVQIAPSKIHGVGIFALCDISKGTKLYVDNMPEVFNLPYDRFNQLFPYVRRQLLGRWPTIVNGSAFIYPDARFLAYMNHSDEANFDAFEDRTLKDIKKGEEITEDYKKIANYTVAFPWLVPVVV